MFDIPQELKNLPQKPGVYIMKNANGGVIYVGKAVNLRHRVRSYFYESADHWITIKQMVKEVDHFEYVITSNEIEALILENNLIKLHRPRYNTRLKDDKTYPYIKVTAGEKFPRVVFTRDRKKDKSRYYGPYVSAERVREIIGLIQKIWPLRRCQRVFPRDYGRERPCLNHHIGQCKAPCNKFIDELAYGKILSEAESFIQGKTREVAAKLEQEMFAASMDEQYERAAELRDLINNIAMLAEKQKADFLNDDDRDVIGMARKEDEALIQVFIIRGGKMTGREQFMMQANEETKAADILAAFVKQFYSEAAFVPKELALPEEPTDRESITTWLTQIKGSKIVITTPQKGEKKAMLSLAQQNAELSMNQFGSHLKREKERNVLALKQIAEAMQIDNPLERIEAYDISNIQGYESVGSMVVFENGKAKNNDYRKFKIKGVIGPDDYASMEEVITRRFTRYLNEREAGTEDGKFARLPDMLMIDGGKGQVNAAIKTLENMGLSLPVCGMVKDERHRTRGLMFNNEEITMPKNSEGFKLITRIQDEVHRFAVEYHRKLRVTVQLRSVLDDIAGIGPKRRKALLNHFKSIEAIREADLEMLAAAPSMSTRAAEAVFAFFRQK
jgi:excinuclease ABC subunit C